MVPAAACTNLQKAPESVLAPSTTARTATVGTENSPAGPILATGSGRTLYAFSIDTPSRSACTSVDCKLLWPPLLVQGTPSVSGGAQSSLVGVIQRPDGGSQVTYAGRPLYTYKEDISAGMVTGQALFQYGGVWYVLAPNGQPITKRINFSGSGG